MSHYLGTGAHVIKVAVTEWVTTSIRTTTSQVRRTCLLHLSILRSSSCCSDPCSTWHNQAQWRFQDMCITQLFNRWRSWERGGDFSKVTFTGWELWRHCWVLFLLAVWNFTSHCPVESCQPWGRPAASNQTGDWVMAVQFQNRGVRVGDLAQR